MAGCESLSARRAWIEIRLLGRRSPLCVVALRKESVDRNLLKIQPAQQIQRSLSARRAWIEIQLFPVPAAMARSLSARRAWIEIGNKISQIVFIKVSLSARRAWIEITLPAGFQVGNATSLSARRAWIEIFLYAPLCCFCCVALRKESVDRNKMSIQSAQYSFSRSPQGERG